MDRLQSNDYDIYENHDGKWYVIIEGVWHSIAFETKEEALRWVEERRLLLG